MALPAPTPAGSGENPSCELRGWGPHPLKELSAAHVTLIVVALRQLRSGDREVAIALLEEHLDLAVSGLLLGPDVEEPERRRYIRALRRAKSYRGDYPRADEDPEIRSLVEAALAQVNPGSNIDLHER